MFSGLIPTEHCLNITSSVIAVDYVHLVIITLCPSSDGCFQHDNAPCHIAQTGFLQ